MLVLAMVLMSFSIGKHSRGAYVELRSDIDQDGDVDIDDLTLFSQEDLRRDWQTVDWCHLPSTLPLRTSYQPRAGRFDARRNPRVRMLLRHYRVSDNSAYAPPRAMIELYTFINEYFGCQDGSTPRLAVINSNEHPIRLAKGVDGNIYVTDSEVSSVFIYDSSLNLTGELTGLDMPLGLAVDPAGNIYVGSYGKHNVEVYDPDGVLTRSIGNGTIKRPVALALDVDGNLYVADGEIKRVWVFAPGGTLLRNIGSAGIGNGRLQSPCSLVIRDTTDGSGHALRELYVGDAAQSLVHVFDVRGTFLRALGGKPTQGMLGYKLAGKFAKLQALQMDAAGRLHVLDAQMSYIQIVNPATGGYLAEYGTRGTDPGQLTLPLDIVIDSSGQMVVADYGNRKVERIAIP